MKTRNYILLGVLIIILINIALYLRFRFSDTYKEHFDVDAITKRVYYNIVELEFDGLLIDIRRDTSNRYKETMFIQIQDSIFKLPKNNDQSGLYDYLEKGDSIYKKQSSPIFRVVREGNDTTFLLDYGIINDNNSY